EAAPAPGGAGEVASPPASRAEPTPPLNSVRPATPSQDSEASWRGGHSPSGLAQRAPSRRAVHGGQLPKSPFHLVQFQDVPAADRSASEERLESREAPAASNAGSDDAAEPAGTRDRNSAPTNGVPEILVSITPTGIIIAS